MATTATQTQSWISRLGGSFKNVIFGIILFVVAFPVLFNNEGRAVRRAADRPLQPVVRRFGLLGVLCVRFLMDR